MKVEQLLKYYQKTVDTHHAAEQTSVIECALNILFQKNKDEIIKKMTQSLTIKLLGINRNSSE